MPAWCYPRLPPERPAMPKHRLSAVALLVIALTTGGRAEAGSAGKPIWFYRVESAAGQATLFTATEVARIRARAACNGLDGAVERLRLSFIATIVALPCPRAGAGGDAGGSYEEGLELAAQRRGLKITGLETAEEEFAALAALPDRLFIGEIKELAAHPDRADKTLDRMIALYNDGDFDGLYDLMLSTAPKNAADRKLFMQKVLLDRNHNMVERLADVLAEGNALVVVGALHFPGEGGIVDLLKQQGFRITMVDGGDGALR